MFEFNSFICMVRIHTFFWAVWIEDLGPTVASSFFYCPCCTRPCYILYDILLRHRSTLYFCVKFCPSHFFVVVTIQGLNLCWPFCSFLSLLCRPFPGISSLHHVFGGPCHEILYQSQIQLVCDLPHVG